MATWVVRAGKKGEQEQTALDNNLVTIHWNELPDLNGIKNKDELETLYRSANPDETRAQAISAGVSQVWAFLSEMAKGDLAVIPLKSRTALAIGEVTGPYAYRTDLGDNEVRHTRPVKWLTTDLLKTTLKPDLLDMLGWRKTVYKLKGDSTDSRIRAILAGKSESLAIAADTEVAEVADPEEAATNELLNFIQLNFPSHKFADLVAAVLKAEGYETKVSSPGPDGGVDILAGSAPMGFGEPRLVVQVKARQQPADVTDLRGLQGVLNTFGAKQGLFVSRGGFNRDVRKEARQSFFQIRLWDSGDLLNAIFKNYRKFPEDLRAELPLKRIWVLASNE